MKIIVRRMYWYPVTPNFVIVDVKGEEWKKFLGVENK